MSNTSATDTETQFHMSSDSGSRVQLTDCGTKPTTTAKVAPEHQVEVTLSDVMVLTTGDTQGVRPKARRSLSDFTEAGASSSSSVPSAQAQHETLMRKASGGSLFGTAEIAQDFVMIDLKTPFAQTCVMSPYKIQMRLNPSYTGTRVSGPGSPLPTSRWAHSSRTYPRRRSCPRCPAPGPARATRRSPGRVSWTPSRPGWRSMTTSSTRWAPAARRSQTVETT